ncbi:hypothetical protein FRC19_001998 [Serendipita sp. 401]|nr:hypothetical protein FRC19_001998 [Serendipita sp. 401]
MHFGRLFTPLVLMVATTIVTSAAPVPAPIPDTEPYGVILQARSPFHISLSGIGHAVGSFLGFRK